MKIIISNDQIAMTTIPICAGIKFLFLSFF